MIKIERAEVFGISNALYGMRLPKQSNDKSDSYCDDGILYIGDNDLKLAQTLIKAGSDHRKFLRQISVSMAITAPRYWWSEMDTYKVATAANSESTMHRLAQTPITRDCFSFDDIEDLYYLMEESFEDYVQDCERLRLKYLETNDKRYWRALIQMLPSSWNQTRMWSGNFEVLFNIISARDNHKLSEWSDFIEAIKNLPYAQELLFFKGGKS
jgi:hypothetical protein